MAITKDERLQRFWARVDKNGDCWLWTGQKQLAGYGVVKWDGKGRRAHHIAWELERGPRPSLDLELDHLCRVRACVNPAHLEWVTHEENTRRAEMARGKANGNGRKTHCKHGHEFTPENTRIGANNKRYCRACHRADSTRRWQEGKRSPASQGLNRTRGETCSGSGQRTKRGGLDERDRCPVCDRLAYVRLDGTTGVHYR